MDQVWRRRCLRQFSTWYVHFPHLFSYISFSPSHTDSRPFKINEERLEAGKGPVGFVNPVLYAYPEVLNDITNGTTAGCGTWGFAAIPGWDPATGLGTPNYPKMKELFMSLP